MCFSFLKPKVFYLIKISKNEHKEQTYQKNDYDNTITTNNDNIATSQRRRSDKILNLHLFQLFAKNNDSATGKEQYLNFFFRNLIKKKEKRFCFDLFCNFIYRFKYSLDNFGQVNNNEINQKFLGLYL